MLVVDPLPSRLALAKALGAEVVVGVRASDVNGAIAAWTDDDGPACVFEAAGSPAVLEQAMRMVAASGTIVIVGLSANPAAIPLISFTPKD